MYLYEDTIHLVNTVEEAAQLIETDGEKAFEKFSRKDSKWFNDKIYLFAYDINGTCLFNPASPHIVGVNLINMTDITGKPVIRMITDIAKKPQKDASGWVFYYWADRSQFDPLWKSSYIRKAISPDNRIYLIGSGLNDIKTEKLFIKENVDNAVNLIRERGQDAAFNEFRDPASSFCFFNSYIFVIDSAGRILVDPSFPGLSERNMLNFKDAVGREIVKEMIDKLSKSDDVWIQYLWPKPGESIPSRKLLYCRKLIVNSETLYVCSDFYLATPIWMRL